MEAFLYFLAGLIAGYFVNMLSSAHAPWFQLQYRRVRRRIRRRLGWKAAPSRELLAIGSIPISWVVLDGGHTSAYSQEALVTSCVPAHDTALLKEFRQLRQQIDEHETVLQLAAGNPAWNGDRYQLVKWGLDRYMSDESPEDSRLYFQFAPSNYLNFLTSQHLLRAIDLPSNCDALRQEVGSWHDFDRPLPYMAHSFGINLVPITSDNFVIISERGDKVRSRSGTWNVAVNEGLQRPVDNNAYGAPDFYKAAERGIFEELGITLGKDNRILFLSFGVDPQLQQYGLLGLVDLSLTAEQMQTVRLMGVKDRWEAKQIQFIPLDAHSIGQALRDKKPWAPSGAVALIHALIYKEQSVRRVMAALQSHGFVITS